MKLWLLRNGRWGRDRVAVVRAETEQRARELAEAAGGGGGGGIWLCGFDTQADEVEPSGPEGVLVKTGWAQKVRPLWPL